jgi:hypothetical protein
MSVPPHPVASLSGSPSASLATEPVERWKQQIVPADLVSHCHLFAMHARSMRRAGETVDHTLVSVYAERIRPRRSVNTKALPIPKYRRYYRAIDLPHGE